MTAPRLLDLFCGAGGAAMGYHRAGFDVVGVDLKPQPHYPFLFHQADALTVMDDIARWKDAHVLAAVDAIHASPPCQDHSRTAAPHAKRHGTAWMLAAMRKKLQAQHRPWVIENVPGAPMRADYRLCGCLFNLPGLRRDRWFETSWHGFDLRAPCHHTGRAVTVAGHSAQGKDKRPDGTYPTHDDWRRAMDINWMKGDELAQAIPPAYTEYIGRQLLAAMEVAA